MIATSKEGKVFAARIAAMLIATLFCVGEASSQFYSRTYGGSGRDAAYAFQLTADGGLIVAGETTSFSSGQADVWVLKFAADGAIEWQRSYGGGRWDRAYAVHQTNDRGYVVAGWYQNTGTRGDYDLWVLKLGREGEVQWQKTYGGTERDEAHSIRQTSDGGYIVAGETNSVGWDVGSVWVLKLGSNGSVEWQKSYGGDRDQQAESVRQTSDGGYIVAGATDSFGQGQGDFWVLKLRADGTVEWQKTYGGARLDYAYEIQRTIDGGYIVAGESASFDPRPSGALEGSCGFLDTGCFDAWLLKLSPEGAIQWQKSYGGAAYDRATSIQQTSDGGYVAAGQTSSFGGGWYGWAFKLDPSGSLKWDKTYGYGQGGGTDARSIRQTADGNYALVGSTNALGAGSYDILLFKLDDQGHVYSCPLVGPSDAAVVDTSVAATDTSAVARDTSAIPGAPAVSVLSSSASASELCFTMGVLSPRRWEWQDWLDRIIECARGPAPGTQLPRCSPPACPECVFPFSIDAAERKIPDYLPSLYREILFWLSLPDRNLKLPESSIRQLEELFNMAPAGPNYDSSLKGEVADALRQIRLAGEINPVSAGKLAEATSAIELDLSVPSRIVKKAGAGNAIRMDLEGVARLSLKSLKRPGTAALRVKNGLPASRPGFMPPWPVFTYDFEGTHLETGSVELSFYFGGINLIGKRPDIRLFEWDGKAYRDITTAVDMDRMVVTGRTDRPAQYVIMTPDLDGRR